MKHIENLEKLKKKLNIDENGAAQSYFVATCYRYMDKYVPKDTGMLRAIVSLDRNSITYMSPYASYQYYGQRQDGTRKVRKYTTLGTGKEWDKTMMKLDGKKVINEVKKYVRNKNK